MPANEVLSVPVVSRWLWPGNRTFLEVASMVVTWWIVAFCAVFFLVHLSETNRPSHTSVSLRLSALELWTIAMKYIKLIIWLKSCPLTLTLPGPSTGVSGSLDSYCSLKPLCSGMGEVVPARTSPTLLPPSPRTTCAVIILFQSVAVHQLSWLAL